MSPFRALTTIAIVPILALSATSQATTESGDDEPRVATDRPSFGAAAATVPSGMVQLEAGVDVAIDETTTVTLPVAFFRIGLNEVLELQLAPPSVQLSDGEDTLGVTRIALKTAGSVGRDLSLGVLTALDLPDGEEDVFGQADFSVTGLADLSVSEVFGLSVNLGVAMVERDEPREASRQLQQIASVAFSASLPGNLGAYVEGFEIFRPSFDEVAVGADLGVTWLVVRWLQLDVFANFGFSDPLADVIVGAGVGVLGP